MRMAKSGQLRGRVTEDQLIGVLDQVEAAEKGRSGGGAGGGGGAGKIVVSNRLPIKRTAQAVYLRYDSAAS